MCEWHPREKGNNPKGKRDGSGKRGNEKGFVKAEQKNSDLLVCETP
jgi:hypothetical protein